MKRPLAFTLVELLIVMAILSTVMGISMTLMFEMFDFQQRYAEQSSQIQSTNRFIEQFRADARLHYTPSIEPNAETILQWSGGDDKITYSLVQGKFPEKRDLIRNVWQRDKLTATEVFHLTDHAVLRFVAGQDADAGLLALSLWEQPPHTTVISPEELDPFTRTMKLPENSNVAINWRTAIVRIASSQETGGTP